MNRHGIYTEVTGEAIPRDIQARKATSIIMRW